MSEESDPRDVDVVIGAGSGIGGALVQRWREDERRPVLAIARPESIAQWGTQEGVLTHSCDYSDEALEALAKRLMSEGCDVARLVICNGVLQGEGYRPERALSQLSAEAMRRVFEVNTFLPMRVLAALSPVLKHSSAPRIAVLSARVGSIGDNRLGGWYSYRASKAALNMMLKCAAQELRRVNRRAKLIAYHPGTVDTPLSKPFQASVAVDNLLSADRAAAALEGVLNEATVDGELSYLDWRGEVIPW
jgi:NAD(P)-dependent dehydrogenase (short-subunit alcohol dehydrogenase family)